MKLNCLFCGNQIFLNHKIFFNCEGGVRCFCCGAMVDIETAGEELSSVQQEENYDPAPVPAYQQRC